MGLGFKAGTAQLPDSALKLHVYHKTLVPGGVGLHWAVLIFAITHMTAPFKPLHHLPAWYLVPGG